MYEKFVWKQAQQIFLLGHRVTMFAGTWNPEEMFSKVVYSLMCCKSWSREIKYVLLKNEI